MTPSVTVGAGAVTAGLAGAGLVVVVAAIAEEALRAATIRRERASMRMAISNCGRPKRPPLAGGAGAIPHQLERRSRQRPLPAAVVNYTSSYGSRRARRPALKGQEACLL